MAFVSVAAAPIGERRRAHVAGAWRGEFAGARLGDALPASARLSSHRPRPAALHAGKPRADAGADTTERARPAESSKPKIPEPRRVALPPRGPALKAGDWYAAPSEWPVLGSLVSFKTRGLLPTFLDAWAVNGDIFRTSVPTKPPFFTLAHPEYIKHVLVDRKANYVKKNSTKELSLVLGRGLATAAESENWPFSRRLIQPVFAQKRVSDLAEVVTREAHKSLDEWQARVTAAGGTTVLDAKTEMLRLTMSVIARLMLDVDIRTDASGIHDLLAFAFAYAGDLVTNPLQPPTWVPTPRNRRFNDTLAAIDRFVYGIVDARLAARDATGEGEGKERDFLDLLIAARDPETGGALTRKQLRDEVITMVGGGYETSATTLTWALYALASNPHVLERAVAEIDDVLGGREATVEDLPRLGYMRLFMMEVMRLFPTIWVFMRDAVEDDEIGGVPIPAGSGLLISTFLVHRHPHFWERPEEFDPERFRDGPPEAQHAYIPFGAGPRHCIGSNFANVEVALSLVAILQRFRVGLEEGHPDVRFEATTMCWPAPYVRIAISPRH
eukprot:tig00000403_g355.t1